MNKKIYLLLFTLSIGGAERHASSIANYLAANGYDVTIVLLQDGKVQYELEDSNKVICLNEVEYPEKVGKVRFSEKVKLSAARRLSRDRYEQYDRLIYINKTFTEKLNYYFSTQPEMQKSLVLSFMTIPNLCAAMCKRKHGYTLILAEFNSPHLEFAENAPENQFKKKYFRFAEGFVFQTKEQQEFYTYLPNVKAAVIPNPIEPIKIEPFVGDRKREIVNFCRHVPFKNLPLLIEAFSKLSPEYPDYLLVIYGDGPQKHRTEQCIADYGLQEKVLLKPFASNVLELVRESAMFVSSSDREGISNSMLEAMAIGLPVICTDCPAGGPKMFIRPYENGITVPVRDADALYRAMRYMIEHPDEAERMASKAVEIRDTLEKNKILIEWLSFIKTVCN